MSTWGLATTAPLADFPEDPEDLSLRYSGRELDNYNS